MQTTETLTRELDNPYTLLSFVPQDFHDEILKIPEHLTNIDEEDLLSILATEFQYTPTTTLNSLRVRFWYEFDVAFAKKMQMNMMNVYLGVCSNAQFFKIVRNNPHQLAYLLCEPPEYKTAMEGLEPLQLRVWKNILGIPMKENGKMQDPKILELQHKVALAIDLRNKGGYLNRSETKNLTMLHQKSEHVHSHKVIESDTGDLTAAQIEDKIREEIQMLEEAARMQLPPPTPKFDQALVVDAEYTDVKKRDE